MGEHRGSEWYRPPDTEVYPFWCEECDDDKRTAKYPWILTTEIIAA